MDRVKLTIGDRLEAYRYLSVAGLLSVAILALLPQSCTQVGTSPFVNRDRAVSVAGPEAESLIVEDFTAFDPDYPEKHDAYGKRLRSLAGALAAIQATGNEMACSNQIYLEAKWLYLYTADWQRLEERLADMGASLGSADQAFATRQSPEEGLWGVCYDVWFLKAEATFEAIEDLWDEGGVPDYPIRGVERVASPQKLQAYLESLLISDIAETGRDNRAELASMTSLLSAAFFKDDLQHFLDKEVWAIPSDLGRYPWTSFAAVYEEFLSSWQSAGTGYWGAWYRHDGQVYKTADLSITYHTIAYRGGQVDLWPKIIDTTFSIERSPYPFGWMHSGHFNNHNSYDVARIFRLGWPQMTAAEKQQAGAAISAMLNWTLTESLDAEGRFKIDPTFFDSLAAEYYFGVSFLDKIGFWDPARRFWTSSDFPQAIRWCRSIKARLAELRLDWGAAREALRRLDRNCPAD